MRTFFAIMFLILLSGCASSDFLVLEPSSVEMLLDEPDRAYQTIALIEVSDQSWDMDLQTLADKILEEASKLGADAVIIGAQSTESGAFIVPIGYMWYAGALNEKKIIGKAIVFRP